MEVPQLLVGELDLLQDGGHLRLLQIAPLPALPDELPQLI
jgi:hypothetical protein